MTDSIPSVPEYEKLYVVSDLHMGGKKGFRIFEQGKALGDLICWIARQESESTALLLNGDIVDFLAEYEKPGCYLDPGNAIATLQGITEDQDFAPVWEGLRFFLQQPHGHLIFVLGNHDLELALPPVREWLLGYLCQDDNDARGRVTLALDGSGYACRVGGKEILCVHGNEEDVWNLVDHFGLVKVGRAMNRRVTPEPWSGNAGTHLVVDVMNRIKGHFRFVDLLKPEVEGVIPIVLALDPGTLKYVTELPKLGNQLAEDVAKHAAGLLAMEKTAGSPASGDQPQPPSAEERTLQLLQGAFHGWQSGATEQASLADDLAAAFVATEDGQLRDQAAPFHAAAAADTLSWASDFVDNIQQQFRAFTRWVEGKKEEALRQALLRWVGEKDCFRLDAEDEFLKPYQERNRVGRELSFLIAGHTHLHRSINLGQGTHFFNSGTWATLIRLSPQRLRPEVFKSIYGAFEEGSLDALRNTAIPPIADEDGDQTGLLLYRRTLISVTTEGDGRVVGRLALVDADPDPNNPAFPGKPISEAAA